jgi:hypothetical protein
MIVQKYGTPADSAYAHVALLSEVPPNDLDTMPTLEECTGDFDDNEVSVPFTFVAFSSSIAPGRDLSQFGWLIPHARSTPPVLKGSVLTLRAMAHYDFLL